MGASSTVLDVWSGRLLRLLAMRHARTHAATTGRLCVRSLEAGENWRWCYAHEQYV